MTCRMFRERTSPFVLCMRRNTRLHSSLPTGLFSYLMSSIQQSAVVREHHNAAEQSGLAARVKLADDSASWNVVLVPRFYIPLYW